MFVNIKIIDNFVLIKKYRYNILEKKVKDNKIKARNIPEPTIKRLSRYMHLLLNLKKEGRVVVSSTFISNELSLDPTQVRKDIQHTGIIGSPKIGFNIDDVINAIQKTLNWDKTEKAFLVGAGNLGKSLLRYSSFKNFGLEIVAAFDTDDAKIGTNIGGIEILNVERLVVLAKLMKVRIGIITVPFNFSQQVADIMVDGGIQAIWNFAQTRLRVPEDTIVENTLLTQNLAVLTNKLSKFDKRKL